MQPLHAFGRATPAAPIAASGDTRPNACTRVGVPTAAGCVRALLPVHQCVGRVAVRVCNNITCVRLGLPTHSLAVAGAIEMRCSYMSSPAASCQTARYHTTQHRVGRFCAVLGCTALRSCSYGGIWIMLADMVRFSSVKLFYTLV